MVLILFSLSYKSLRLSAFSQDTESLTGGKSRKEVCSRKSPHTDFCYCQLLKCFPFPNLSFSHPAIHTNGVIVFKVGVLRYRAFLTGSHPFVPMLGKPFIRILLSVKVNSYRFCSCLTSFTSYKKKALIFVRSYIFRFATAEGARF